MARVTTTGASAAGTEPGRTRLDRRVLVSNIVSGALWLLPLAVPWSDLGSWVLFGTGAVYVATPGVFLVAVHAREVLTRPHVVAEFFHVDSTSRARRKIGLPVLHLLEHENFDEQAEGYVEGITGLLTRPPPAGGWPTPDEFIERRGDHGADLPPGGLSQPVGGWQNIAPGRADAPAGGGPAGFGAVESGIRWVGVGIR